MKIGICCFPTVGGSGIVATQLAIELAKKGQEVVVISYDTPFLLRTIRHPNLKLSLVDILDYPLFKDIGAPYTILCASKMIRLIEEENLDLLNVHYAIPAAVSAYLAKQVTKIPIALTAHGSDIHTLGVDPAYNPVMSHIFDNVDGLSTVSNYLKEEMETKFRHSKEIGVFYNPIDTDRYKRVETKICDFRLKYSKYFVHVSNFRPVKQTPFIVEVFAEIVKEFPDLGLIMIGEGPERKMCEELAMKLSIADNVLFQGVRSVLPPIYSCSSALLSASTSESFGLTLAEAMACEVPVIAPKIGGIPEVVDHGINGFVYEPKNKKEFIDYALRILNDENLEREMGKKGREKVLANFNVSKVTDMYLEWYEAILSLRCWAFLPASRLPGSKPR